MNDAYIDPLFVNLAISHSQFETIHAYRDGNGRLGRALIPIQLVEIGILEFDDTYAKKGYKYKEIYNVFVGKDLF